MIRTDRNNNPVAFTVKVAEQAGLKLGLDYEQGDPFFDQGSQYFTAKLLGDPIETTLRVIDAIGFYTKAGFQRWAYIGLPSFVWRGLSREQKIDVIGFMYQHEGGSSMMKLFSDYGLR